MSSQIKEFLAVNEEIIKYLNNSELNELIKKMSR
jgi:hypothetical protein